MGDKLIDLTGQTFGRLTVLGRAPDRHYPSKTHVMWHCQCACGNEVTIQGRSLRSGHSQSCGCLRDEVNSALHRTHGKTGTAEYRIWKGMIGRCYNPNNQAFAYYGWRGITVSDAWRKSVEQVFTDIG